MPPISAALKNKWENVGMTGLAIMKHREAVEREHEVNIKLTSNFTSKLPSYYWNNL